MQSKPHAPIPPPYHPTYDFKKAVRDALEEDAGGRGDVTTLATIPETTQAVARFLAKADGVLAGLGLADLVFEMVDPTLQVSWSARDGERVSPGTEFGVVRGSARSILVAERVALNFMQRMSGIATATQDMVQAASSSGEGTKILETRKTVPGLRLLDKWAVLIGGGHNHRMGLYDMMMIKDNHIAAAGGIKAAVQRAQQYIAHNKLEGMQVEVETRTLEEVEEILEVIKSGGSCVSRVMLDNMTHWTQPPAPTAAPAAGSAAAPGAPVLDVSMLRAAVARIAGAVETEASGNVTLASVASIASTGVTYISVGALTHSVTALDISLKIKTE